MILRELARAAAARSPAPTRLWRARREADLRISLDRLPDGPAGALWSVELEELPRLVPIPASWQELLSPREREVASRALTGWDRGHIAEDLECSEETVKTHLSRVFQKLGVDGRAGLWRRARLDP